MDPVMTHLRLNHFPVALSLVALGMLVLALIFRRRFLWQYAMTTALLAGIAVIPTFITGDPAAEAVRNTWYISRQAVRAHDESAGITIWILIISGLISLYGLWRAARTPLPRPQYRDLLLPGWLKALAAIGIIASAVSAGWTGYLGGEIVHGSAQLRLQRQPPAAFGAPVGAPAGGQGTGAKTNGATTGPRSP